MTLNNGFKIPAIGFGTYKAGFSDVISRAIEAGYRYFDTASFYGTESLIGEAISQSGMKREEFIIASKLWKGDMGYKAAIEAFNKTLDSLKTDYVDVFMIHWPRPDLTLKDWKALDLETWQALEELHEQGKIKALGLSNFLPYHAENILNNCKVKPSVTQMEFHPGYTQAFALNYYRDKNILVQAWSPTGRGRVFQDELIIELSAKYKISPVQLCLAFCLSEGVMPLPKASSLEHMKANLESVNISLEPEDISRIENMPPVGWSGEHPDRVRVKI